MSQIKIETVEKNFDSILETVGTASFINWEKFSHSSAEIINTIEELNRKLSVFREYQHKNFIQTMKKLKSLDLPDLIGAVKSKKLPKEALRGVLTRFKVGESEKIELVEPVETLKSNANKELEDYIKKNDAFVDELKKYMSIVDQKIKQSGYVTEPAVPALKSTVKIDLSEQLATKIASQIKIDYIPGTHYIALKTYSEIVEKSFDLIKQQNTRISKDARVLQRANIKDNKKYLDVMSEYLLNSEVLIIEGQKLLAKKVGLGANQLEDSEVFMIEKGYGNHLMMIQSQLRSKIKQSIPPTKEVSYESAKEIISFQTSMLTQKRQVIKAILDHLQKTQESIQTIPMILALILNDMVFEKYGFEEEDFMKNVSEEVIAQKPELGNIFKEMEINIIKLMQYIGVVTKEVGDLLQQGAVTRGQPQNQPPNLMQGMNPMQMLELQQMQQFQQMQQMANKQPPL